jgi:hypothetical protein
MTEKLEDHTEELDQISNPTKNDDVEETDVTHDSPQESVTGNDESEPVDNSDESEDSPDTFPREYVEKLRDENAKYRQRAQRADTLAQRLHEALVTATGRLQDPTDLAFDESHLDDPEALQAAIEDLLARKPHLASRRPLGDIGQGPKTGDAGEVDLAALLRSRA